MVALKQEYTESVMFWVGRCIYLTEDEDVDDDCFEKCLPLVMKGN